MMNFEYVLLSLGEAEAMLNNSVGCLLPCFHKSHSMWSSVIQLIKIGRRYVVQLPWLDICTYCILSLFIYMSKLSSQKLQVSKFNTHLNSEIIFMLFKSEMFKTTGLYIITLADFKGDPWRDQ